MKVPEKFRANPTIDVRRYKCPTKFRRILFVMQDDPLRCPYIAFTQWDYKVLKASFIILCQISIYLYKSRLIKWV